jgi:hypothetical protein
VNKYRIVSREDAQGLTYFAQVKFFDLFWKDLPFTSQSGTSNWKEGFETPSRTLKLVENYVEKLIKKETELRTKSSNQEIVKLYYDPELTDNHYMLR